MYILAGSSGDVANDELAMELSRQMVIPAALQRSDSDEENDLAEKTPRRGIISFLQKCKTVIIFLRCIN